MLQLTFISDTRKTAKAIVITRKHRIMNHNNYITIFIIFGGQFVELHLPQ